MYLFLKMIMPSFFTFVLGILITTFIYPWYNKENDKGKYLIALLSPLTGVIFKAISRICVQRLWNITHPGYSYVLLVPSYFGLAINFRFLYQWVYIEGDFPSDLFVEFALRTSIALVIEWFFSSVSLTIVTRYQNMAAMGVWRKRWKRHIIVAFVNTVPLALCMDK